MNNFFEKFKGEQTNNKKKIENIVSLVIILIITLIVINTIWNGNTIKKQEKNDEEKNVILATEDEETNNLEQKLENILSTIKGVGRVNVFVNYSESSSVEALYDETTTTSSTEEGDSSGGTRNVTETEVQKDIVFSEKSGSKDPVTQKTIMPVVQGAIVTAEGVEDMTVKTNIISAVQAVTGLSIDKVQVFEMK